jgi:peptide/nickel transport system substrate-binding protein
MPYVVRALPGTPRRVRALFMARVASLLYKACIAGIVVFGISSASLGAQTVLRTRLSSDILSLDPGTLRDEFTDLVQLHMIEGLVALRENGEVGPMLAKDWTISPDGKTYTFHLRSGVHFHNGAPLTSAEVAWTLRRYLRPEIHWRCLVDLNPSGITEITSIETPSPLTVVIRLSKAAPIFLRMIARNECGETGILHPDSVGPDGKFRKPIGTGPFMFKEWKRNQYIELERFPEYAALPGPRDGNTGGKHALVDRVRFLIIPDASAARIALLRGNLDVLDNLDTAELASVQGKPGLRIDITEAMDSWLILLQTKDRLLADERLRQALAMSIDDAGLTRVITFGTAKPDSSPIPNVSPFHGPKQAQLRHPDLEAARRLVRESSYRGETLHLVANHRIPQMLQAAVLVQAMAEQIGVHIDIDTMDWASQMSRYSVGDYQMMAFSFSARLDPSFSLAILIGNKAKEPRKTWDTPEARSLLAESEAVGDPVQRQAIFDQLESMFREYVPAIELYNSSRISVVRDNVVGFKGWPANQTRLWGVGFTTGNH